MADDGGEPKKKDQDENADDKSPYNHTEGWRLEVWKCMDAPDSSKTARMWSLFMMFVILYSILNFTLASIPWPLVIFDVWVNRTTGNTVLFSTGSDYVGGSIAEGGDGMYRSDSTQQSAADHNEYNEPWRSLEVFCIATFTLEFVVRLITCPAGPGFVPFMKGASNIIDLISILPFYFELVMTLVNPSSDGADLGFLQILRLIRLTRIVRIFKMSKNFEGLIVLGNTIMKSLSALVMLFFFMSIFSVLFATLIYMAEKGDWDPARNQWVREDGSATPFESIPASTWWTIITMTTVGYGDHYPVTSFGRVVAVLTMTVALIVLSLPITIIGANFDEEYNDMRQRKIESDKQKLEKKALELHSPMASKGLHTFKTVGEVASKFGVQPISLAKTAGIVSPAGSPTGTVETAERAPRRDSAKPKPSPLHGIQSIIEGAHVELMSEVQDLMRKQEKELEKQIELVLKQCSSE